MGKDLRDAVLAAFEEDAGEETGEETGPAGGNEEDPEPAAAGEKAGSAAKPVGKSAKVTSGPTAKKARAHQPAGLARSKAGAGRRSAKTAPPAEAAGGKKHVSGKNELPHARPGKGSQEAAAVARGSRWPLMLSLCLNVAVVVLLIVLLIRTSGAIKEFRGALDGIRREVVDTREVAKYSRIKLGTFMEPNKRPQAVIVVVEEKDGRLRLGKTVIRPLEKGE